LEALDEGDEDLEALDEGDPVADEAVGADEGGKVDSDLLGALEGRAVTLGLFDGDAVGLLEEDVLEGIGVGDDSVDVDGVFEGGAVTTENGADVRLLDGDAVRLLEGDAVVLLDGAAVWLLDGDDVAGQSHAAGQSPPQYHVPPRHTFDSHEQHSATTSVLLFVFPSHSLVLPAEHTLPS